MLSAEGKCFAFDDRGDGFGRGEGVGVIALKRLSDAIIHGDVRIRGREFLSRKTDYVVLTGHTKMTEHTSCHPGFRREPGWQDQRYHTP